MGRRFKDVRPDKVHQVRQRVFAAETVHAQRHVLDRGTRGLSMNQISEKKYKSKRQKFSLIQNLELQWGSEYQTTVGIRKPTL